MYGEQGEVSAQEAQQFQMMKTASSLGGTRPTKRQELEMQRVQLLAHVQKINDAIDALDRNPGAEEVMNAIDKCRF